MDESSDPNSDSSYKMILRFKKFIVGSGIVSFFFALSYVFGGQDDGVSYYDAPLDPGHGFFSARSLALMLFFAVHFWVYRALPKEPGTGEPEGFVYWIPVILGGVFASVLAKFVIAH